MPRVLPSPWTSAGASPSRPSGSSSSSGVRCQQSPWWSCPPGPAQTCKDCKNKEFLLLLYSPSASPSRAAARAAPTSSNQKFMSVLYWTWAFLCWNHQLLCCWQDTSVQIWQGFLLPWKTQPARSCSRQPVAYITVLFVARTIVTHSQTSAHRLPPGSCTLACPWPIPDRRQNNSASSPSPEVQHKTFCVPWKEAVAAAQLNVGLKPNAQI